MEVEFASSSRMTEDDSESDTEMVRELESALSDRESERGLLAVGSNRGHVAILNLDAHRLVEGKIGCYPINCLKFSQDEKKLYAAIGSDFQVLDSENPENVLNSYRYRGLSILDFCVHSSGRQAYTCAENVIHCWDFRSPKPTNTYTTYSYKESFSSIDVVSSENTIIAGDTAGYLRFWDLRENREPYFTCLGGKGNTAVSTIAVSPDKSWILLGTEGGDVYESVYKDKLCSNRIAIEGSKRTIGDKSVKDGVVRCSFGKDESNYGVVAYRSHIGEFYKNGKEIINPKVFSHPEKPDGVVAYRRHIGQFYSRREIIDPKVFSHPEKSDISCLAVNDECLVSYTGLCSGHVICYNHVTHSKYIIQDIIRVNLHGELKAMALKQPRI